MGNVALALTPVLAHRFRDGVVEAEIERLELGRGNGRLLLDGELGDRLADVSVIVNDLPHGDPLEQEVVAVPARGLTERIVVDHIGRPRQPQRIAELVQKYRDPVRKLVIACGWARSGTDTRMRARDNRVTVRQDKCFEHGDMRGHWLQGGRSSSRKGNL